MGRQVIELMVRIRNLKDLENHCMRIDEKDIRRKIHEMIISLEKELRVLKNKKDTLIHQDLNIPSFKTSVNDDEFHQGHS